MTRAHPATAARILLLAAALAAATPATARTVCVTVTHGTTDWGSYGTITCTPIDRPRDPRPIRLR